MEGNSRLPGVATEPRFRVRAIEHEIVGDLDEAVAWARDACVLGESEETLLPAMLWAIDKAAEQLAHIERQLDRVGAPARGMRYGWRFVWTRFEDLLKDELALTWISEQVTSSAGDNRWVD